MKKRTRSRRQEREKKQRQRARKRAREQGTNMSKPEAWRRFKNELAYNNPGRVLGFNLKERDDDS